MRKIVLGIAVGGLLSVAHAGGSEFSPTSFSNKFEFTVSGYAGESTLEKFPLLVRLNPEKIANFKYSLFEASDHSDLAFVVKGEDGVLHEVPHEIDTWNPDGESLVWVRVPELAGKTTKLICYFGRSAGGTGVFKPSDVWTDHYAAVWHLNPTDETIGDATGHGLKMKVNKSDASTSAPNANKYLGNSYYTDGAGQDRLLFDNPADYVTSLGTGVETPSLTVSCWFNPSTLSETVRLVCWKGDYSSSSGFEFIKAPTGVMLRGSAGSGSETPVAKVDWANQMTHFVGVYEGAKAWGYANGAKCAAEKDKVVQLKKGTSTVGYCGMGGNSTAGYGCKATVDELRFYNGVASADWAKAEYDTVMTDFVTYGEVEATVAEQIAFGDRPSVTMSADGASWTWSVPVLSGKGAIYAAFTDVATGVETRLPAADGLVTGPATLTLENPAIPPYAFYTWGAVGVTDGFERFSAGEGEIYNGVVTVTAGEAADEATKTAGFFTFTRDASAASVANDLVVRYVVSGTAVNGQTYARVPTEVTIPAGSASATVAITPLVDNLVTSDAEVTVTLEPGRYLTGAGATGSATVVIVNDGSAEFEEGVRYLSPAGNDDWDGTTLATAKATLGAAIASLGAAGGTVRVADGTYVDTVTTRTLYTIETPVTVCSISEDAAKVAFTKGKQSARIFHLNHAGAVLRNVTVKDGGFVNECANGGNVLMDNGLIEQCVLTGGTSGNVVPTGWATGGGNLWMAGGKVSRSVITKGWSRTDRHYGTAVYMTGGLVETCLIAENSNDMTDGGTIRMAESSRLYNCTVVRNTSESASPAFFFGVDQTKPRIVNTVIAGNTVNGAPHVASRYTGNFRNCVADVAIPEGVDCIKTEAFGFTDWANGDYTLTSASPLIDRAVTDDVSQYLALDLAGTARPSGDKLDIGCYEYDMKNGCVSILVSEQVLLEDASHTTSITFTPAVSGISETYALDWDFGDGTTVSDVTGPITHIYTRSGEFAVTVQVTVDGETRLDGILLGGVKICPRVLYVNGEGSGTIPYETVEKGTPDLATAIAYAHTGATIVVQPGVYERNTETNPGQYEVTKAVTVIGATGNPEDVVFRITNGKGMTRNIKVDHADAVVSSLSFENGCQLNYNGGGVYIGSGQVTNCVIRNACLSNGTDNYIFGGGVYMDGGLLTHSKVIGCGGAAARQDGSNGINGLAIAMNKGVCRNCLFTGDYPLNPEVTPSEGVLRRGGNFVYVGGKAVMENCTVAGRRIRYDCQDESSGKPTKDKAFFVGQNATARNCVVADIAYYCFDPEKSVPDGVEVELLSDMEHGTMTNCAIENWTGEEFGFVTGTAADFFANPAKGDYRPKSGGPLHNAGADVTDSETTDLAGRKRCVGRIDIGCYEAQGGLMFIVR